MNKRRRILPAYLYSQLALLVTLILVATSLTYAFFMSKQQAKETHEKMEQSVQAVISSFVATSTHMLSTKDYSALESFLLKASQLPNITSIVITDTTGQVLTSIIHSAGFPPIVNHSIGTIPPPQSEQAYHSHPNELICVHWQPIRADSLLGYMRVDFNLREIRAATRTIWKRTFILSTAWITLSIILLLLTLKRPISAIQKLSEFARRLNTHKGTTFTVDRSCLELEELGKSLNLASEELFLTEQELKAEREQLATTLQSIDDAVITIKTNGTIILFNRAAELITGWTADQAIGKSMYEVLSALKGTEQGATELIRKIMDQGYHKKQLGPLTIVPRNEEKTKTISLFSAPLIDANDQITGAVLTCKDHTEQIASKEEKSSLEKQLHQAQKMEAIGTLAGGIAHDFNNILTPILGYAQLVQYKLPAESELNRYQNEVINSANRAKNLVQQILTFSRSAEQELMPLQIQTVVKEAVKLLRATLPTTIEIRQDINQNCGYVLASPSQVHQIVMNLCTNAFHAMREDGGVLTLSLHPIEISPEASHSGQPMAFGEYVLLQISDTGVGVPQKVIDKIFDPYFTTKPQGEGTGLGLSVVHGIVKSSNGYLDIQSIEGEGTNFRIYLPKTPGPDQTPTSKTESDIPGGTEHILLVDDEPIIVEMETKILSALGYQVTSFTSSETALQTFEKSPDDFALILTDMTMPKLTGITLMQRIRTIRPEVPVIICSGHSENINNEKALQLGANAYIVKPIDVTNLAVVIRGILDRQGCRPTSVVTGN